MPVLAHYWGIDEIGVFVVPAVIAIFVFRRAERRAKRMAAEREKAQDSEPSEDHVG